MSFHVTGPVGIYVGLGQSLGPGNLVDKGIPGKVDGEDAAPAAGNVELPFSIQTNQPVFLGTAERGPRIVFSPRTTPVYCDEFGQHVPFDLLYESEDAFLFAELTRYNEPVLAAVQDRQFKSGDFSIDRGIDRAEGVGTLMKTEGRGCYPVWFSFSYSRKPVFAAAGMPPSYCFPACVAVGPDEFDPLGSRARKVRLMWHALRLTGKRNDSASVLYFLDPNLLPTSN